MEESYSLFTWDWKEQPPLGKILEAFQGMVDYDQVPEYYQPDTGGDYYACIISERELTPEQIDDILEEGV
jgi:hypothetical protein